MLNTLFFKLPLVIAVERHCTLHAKSQRAMPKGSCWTIQMGTSQSAISSWKWMKSTTTCRLFEA